MKKILAILLAVLLTLAAGATCLAQGNPVTITWCIRENANLTREKYEEIVRAFEAEHPEIHVELQLDADLSTTAYLTKIAAGTLPDVIYGANAVVGIDGILSEVPSWLVEKFKPGLLFETEGAIRTVPAVAQGVWGVVYHKSIFEAAGIAELPTTWEEFTAVCDQLIDYGVAPLMGWGTSNQSFFSMMWVAPTLCNELHAAYPDFNVQLKTGEVKWTDPVISNNLKTFQRMAGNGCFYAGTNSLDYGNAETEFMAGNAAMIVDGVWSLTSLDPEEYGVFIMPDMANTNSSTMFTSYWGVKEECKNKDACWTFIDWALCGNGQQIYTDNVLKLDAQISCALEAPSYEMPPLVQEFYGLLSQRETYVNQIEVVGENAMPNGFADYLYTAIADIFFSGADVDATLAGVQTEYEMLLAEQA